MEYLQMPYALLEDFQCLTDRPCIVLIDDLSIDRDVPTARLELRQHRIDEDKGHWRIELRTDLSIEPFNPGIWTGQ